MSQQSAAQYLRHGQTPFFRLPVADPSLPDADAYAAAVPFVLGGDHSISLPCLRAASGNFALEHGATPPHDHSDLTSHLAAHLLYEGLALLVAR